MSPATQLASIIVTLATLTGCVSVSGKLASNGTDAVRRDVILPVDEPMAARVDRLFEPWDKDDSPGAVVGVIRDGKLVYARGYGMADLEHGIPLTPQSVIYVGSIAKQFTAMCVLLLEREGRLALADDIREYLPELPAYERPITIDQLLHHTSGIRDFFALATLAGARDEDYLSADEIDGLIRQQHATNFPPGEEFRYSNSGYWLLARIVARVSGVSFPDFAEQRIFRPLGMSRTAFYDDTHDIIKGRARGHVIRPDGGFAFREKNFAYPGPGGLYTTIEDLFRWDRNCYHPQVGDRAMIDRLLEPGRLSGGGSTGEGAGLIPDNYEGRAVIRHAGNAPGYGAEILRFPEERLTVITLLNIRDATANPTRLAFEVADLYLAKTLSDPPQPAADDVARVQSGDSVDGDLGRFTGHYRRAETGVVFGVAMDGEQLSTTYMSSDGWGRFNLVSANQEAFHIAHFPGPARTIKFRESGIAGQYQLELWTEGRDSPSIYRAVEPLMPTEAAPYLGRYDSEELGRAEYDIRLEDGGLVVRIPGHADRRLFELPLIPLENDTFTDGDQTILRFLRNEQGDVTGLTISEPRAEGVQFNRSTQRCG